MNNKKYFYKIICITIGSLLLMLSLAISKTIAVSYFIGVEQDIIMLAGFLFGMGFFILGVGISGYLDQDSSNAKGDDHEVANLSPQEIEDKSIKTKEINSKWYTMISSGK